MELKGFYIKLIDMSSLSIRVGETELGISEAMTWGLLEGFPV